ncbi:hypothetical protein THAOC_00698, partial [Thalassiosira oceanica]
GGVAFLDARRTPAARPRRVSPGQPPGRDTGWAPVFLDGCDAPGLDGTEGRRPRSTAGRGGVGEAARGGDGPAGESEEALEGRPRARRGGRGGEGVPFFDAGDAVVGSGGGGGGGGGARRGGEGRAGRVRGAPFRPPGRDGRASNGVGREDNGRPPVPAATKTGPGGGDAPTRPPFEAGDGPDRGDLACRPPQQAGPRGHPEARGRERRREAAWLGGTPRPCRGISTWDRPASYEVRTDRRRGPGGGRGPRGVGGRGYEGPGEARQQRPLAGGRRSDEGDGRGAAAEVSRRSSRRR